MADLSGKVDLNTFYDQARKDVAALIGGAGVKGAALFNNSGKTVTFFVYNYSDGINLIAAQKTKVAHGYYGTVAASGSFFKVHPDKDKSSEFLVAPHKAYVYEGPGKVIDATAA